MVTNPQLSALEVPGRVHVADVGGGFLSGDGRIAKTMMGDFLHPSAAGYERLSAAVRPPVDAMTGEK